MDHLITFIEKVCKRPGMYVGKPDMELVEALLGGYELALIDTQNLHSAVFRDFTSWLNDAYPSQDEKKNQLRWSDKLVDMYGEEEAIKNILVMFKKWRDSQAEALH